MANIFGTLNAKGKGGGSETSGCYLLENASTMTHLYAYTYEGLLRDIDNKNDFPLKNGDTLIGDDNYLYKLMTIDEDLGTFTATQFWKLDSPTPTIEITFDQAISADTYELDSDQFGLIQNNEVVKVYLYSESELLTFVKKSDDGSNIVMGTIITYDSNNSVYVYKEAVINVSSYEMTITDMTLSSGGGGKQLYQHNIHLYYSTAKDITLQITNDDNTPLNTKALINSYLYSKGFNTAAFQDKVYPCFALYDSNYYNGITLYSGDLYLVAKGSGTNIQNATLTVEDVVIPL